MRLQIDTAEKKIYLLEDIKLSELRSFLKKTFPNDYKDFTLTSNNYWYLPTWQMTTTTIPNNWPVTCTDNNTNNIKNFDISTTSTQSDIAQA